MGLLTGILTLPLAPIRGTVWIAEQLMAQAEQELGDEPTLRRRLAEAERNYELGVYSLAEWEAIEDELLERLEVVREAREGA
ncbi:MAG TPA: gas vesicle protein GvpG [Gaiellaceae bacterium]|jgi:hypothetical protein|nr:gas vesicle protein GvpG [Gaiellaceae bacterium]